MSHILKKIAIGGAGGKNKKPKPPIYKPPVMGELQYGASYSYAETLDLISDGPIEGLCNRYGEIVDGANLLQGIYLDDTPVAVSSELRRSSNTLPSSATRTLEIKTATLTKGNGVRNFRKFFQAVNQQKLRSEGGYVTLLKKNGTRGPKSSGEFGFLPNVSMWVLRWRKKSGCSSSVPRSKSFYAIYMRAYMKYYGSSDKRFYFFMNDNTSPRSDVGTSQNNAVYRNGNKSWSRLFRMFWLDTNHLSTAKFFFGFGHRSGGGFFSRQNFKKTSDRSEQLVQSEIQNIMNLWNDNNNDLNPNNNLFQQTLAAKALSALNWNGSQMNPGTGAAGNGLFHNWLEKSNSRKAHAIIMVERDNPNLAGKTVVEDGAVANMRTYPYGQNYGWNLERTMKNAGIRIADVTCPEVDADGIMTGKLYGFLAFQFTPAYKKTYQNCSLKRKTFGTYTVAIPKAVKDALKDIEDLKYSKELQNEEVVQQNEFETTNLKYNYANVLAEVKKGEETQTPFRYFRRVYIDHIYASPLFGPFGVKDKVAPQRINPNVDMLTKSKVVDYDATNYNLELGSDRLPLNEGSDDERQDAGGTTRDYSAWANNSLAKWDEQAIPVVHTVYNPNVTAVFITLNVSTLMDTLVTEVNNVSGNSGYDFKVGTKFPTVVNFKVETGRVGKTGYESDVRTYIYRIVALVEGETLIDIGNPDNAAHEDIDKQYVINLQAGDARQQKLNVPFRLPKVNIKNNDILSPDGERGIEAGTIDQDSVEERFVRVTKLSFETNSVLLSKDIGLQKVTEIIEADLPYPFSAIIGTRLDSRAFGAIPKRSFDCKLKLVKVPSNYFPTRDGIDYRYHKTIEQYNTFKNSSDESIKNKLLIYEGDWDGTFRDELVWTDNPAWILYDLLTNERYGMGSHIDINTINKWQLYKIGRFCDAVDDEGYFEGVTDGRGGREPRFSCNVVFDRGEKIYDAINTIAQIFRGRVFFGNSEINFVDDRPRKPVNLFTNESVKEGLFFYSNNRRDEQYNTIEVGFKDRFDNYAPKIECIEDENDIKERGVFKKKIEGVGITSRAMARRMGQHLIYSSISENQTVAFTAGVESLLCQPGDLVIIEDELKTNKANFGKILGVDLEAETIRLTNKFDSSMNTGRLTVYYPTGRDTLNEIDDLADVNRERFQSFTITGAPADSWVEYTGYYGFSGYTVGYSDATIGAADNGEERFEEYGLYTGLTTGLGGTERVTEIYFETGVTGWIFSSGDARSLDSGDFISPYTGDQTLTSFGTGQIANFDGTQDDRRGSTLAAFSGFDYESFVGPYRGVMNNEISGVSPEQITVLSVTGSVVNKTYGSLVSGFDKPEVLPFVKLGSPAKFEIKNASPFIYKVISMKEQEPNEYLVTATKYNTGKFNLIEKNISIENESDTLSYQVAQTINGITYETLPAPTLASITTGIPDLATQTFSISGMWEAVDNSTGYKASLTYPNGAIEQEESTTATGIEFSGLGQVGVFNLSVNALGNNGGIANTNAYFDSVTSSTGIFVVYDQLLVFNKSFLDQITIL